MLDSIDMALSNELISKFIAQLQRKACEIAKNPPRLIKEEEKSEIYRDLYIQRNKIRRDIINVQEDVRRNGSSVLISAISYREGLDLNAERQRIQGERERGRRRQTFVNVEDDEEMDEY